MKLVVVGNGMVGQRFVEALRERDTAKEWAVTVLAEETRPAYDRVRLSAWFDGVSAEELSLHRPDDGVDLRVAKRRCQRREAVARDRHVARLRCVAHDDMPQRQRPARAASSRRCSWIAISSRPIDSM